MKQVQFAEFGGPEVLKYQDIPDPTPGPGQVLVKVEAAGVNYSDLMRRADVYVEPTPLPYVLGVEAAGSVEAVGQGVEHLVNGAPVLAILGHGGGYGQYVVAPAEQIIALPPGISPAEATALVVQGLTAYLTLTRAASLQPGQAVLVHAAAGGMGSLAIQIAKLLGAGQVIGTAGSESKLAFTRSLGADVAINYRDADDWPRQVLDATGGRGADIILESVGGDIFTGSFAALAPFGHLVSVGAASGIPPSIEVMSLFGRNHTLSGFLLSNWFGHGNAVGDALTRLLTWVATGELMIPPVTAYPLESAALAHRAVQSRATTGKVVLTPWP